MSMTNSRLLPHPTSQPQKILFPGTSRFAWVPATGYNGYLKQARLCLLEGQEDAASSYVENILSGEGFFAIPSGPDSHVVDSDEVEDDKNGESSGDDNDDETTSSLRHSAVDADRNQGSLQSTPAEIASHCLRLRKENAAISEAIKTAPGNI